MEPFTIALKGPDNLPVQPKALRFALHNLSYRGARHRRRMDSADDLIVLNVGGKVFCTSLESLNRLPETKLGRLSKSGMLQCSKEIFFDRNPKVMHGVLDLYRTGELHLPSNLCSNLIRKVLLLFFAFLLCFYSLC